MSCWYNYIMKLLPLVSFWSRQIACFLSPQKTFSSNLHLQCMMIHIDQPPILYIWALATYMTLIRMWLKKNITYLQLRPVQDCAKPGIDHDFRRIEDCRTDSSCSLFIPIYWLGRNQKLGRLAELRSVCSEFVVTLSLLQVLRTETFIVDS